MAHDNDLLTLWLAAGDLDRDAVRSLIEQIQSCRDTIRRQIAFVAEVSERLTRIAERFDELRDRHADFQETVDELAGDLEGHGPDVT